jgi:hypothetical protein
MKKDATGREGSLKSLPWKLEIGNWKMENGEWKTGGGDFQFLISSFWLASPSHCAVFSSPGRADVLILTVMSARRHKHSDASS